jgi:hypothetical protein
VIPLATVDPVAAIGLGWTVVVAVLGGIGGGLVTAFLLGRKIGDSEARLKGVETKIGEINTRLDNGDDRFDDLVELSEKAKMLGREIDALSGNLGSVVTEKVCNAKHQVAEALGGAAVRLIEALNGLSAAVTKAACKLPDHE